MQTTKRELYYDIIRIVACLLVILNHTIGVFDKFNVIALSKWVVADLLFFICKTAVPLFLMLSGALLLGKEESYKKFIIHKVIKTIFILITWSIIYKFTYALILDHRIISITESMISIKEFITEPVSVHFWYLYMLIGIYLMTPFIRKMIHNFSQKDYIVFLSLWIIFACLIPFINIIHPLNYSGYFQVPIFTGYIGYYIGGYFLDNIKLNKSTLISSIFTFTLGLLISTTFTYKLSLIDNKTSRALDAAILFPIAISSFALFILIKQLVIIIKEKLSIKPQIINTITNISSKTFGIYLIHMIVISIFKKTLIYKKFFMEYHYSISDTLIFDLVIFILCFLIVTIIKKIPLIKNIV